MVDELPDVEIGAHRALAHPMRHRILMTLRDEPATISGLARRLEVRKGSVAHHLGVLVEAAMVRVAQTRRVRGGTEKYYEAAVRRVVGGDSATAAAMLTAVAAEGATHPDALLHLRHVRLTVEQAGRLHGALEDIVDTAPDAPDGIPHGVLVALYRRPG